MTRMLMGLKPSVGPVLKSMASDLDDPLTTPIDAYGKFLFDSENPNMPYVVWKHVYQWDDGTRWPEATSGTWLKMYFWPDGTDQTDCQIIIVRGMLVSTKYCYQIFLWDRIIQADTPYAPYVEAAGRWPLFQWNTSRQTLTQQPEDAGCPTTISYATMLPHLTVSLRNDNESSFFNNNYVHPSQSLWQSINATTYLDRSYLGQFSVPSSIPYLGYYSIIAMPNAAQYAASGDIQLFVYNIPMNNAEMIAASGTPTPGQKVLKINATEAKMARPGFDVETASDDELIFGGEWEPARVIMAGSVSLAAGASQLVAAPITLSLSTLVKMFMADTLSDGTESLLPHHLGLNYGSSNRNKTLNISATIASDGSGVTFTNSSNIPVGVRYMVMHMDANPPSVGLGSKILERGEDFVRLLRPTAGASLKYADTIFDTRFAFPRLVTEGWVPSGDFFFSSGEIGEGERGLFGRHKATVTWSNDGTWKPYPLWFAERTASGSGNDQFHKRWTGWGVKEIPAQDGVGSMARSGALARLKDTQITFYINNNEREAIWYHNPGGFGCQTQDRPGSSSDNVVGIRYYIFAIPVTV